MEHVIVVEHRSTTGKGAARKLRAQGKVPGILYGAAGAPVPVSVDPGPLQKTVSSSGLGRNTVLHVQGLGRDVLALLKDAQSDSIKRRLVHVDFLEIKEDQEVTVEVPIELTGKAAGVVAGGLIQIVRRTLTLACKPLSIPRSVKVDVTELNIGHSIHVNEVSVPDGSRAMDPSYLALVTCVAPQAEEEKPQAAETAAAGTTPGAAPAAGAAAPAAGAAAGGAAPAAAAKEAKPKK